jgi:lipopolysaccharide transport system permease protein
LQPVLTMVVFSLVFGRFAQIPSDGLPYPIFTFSALLPWQLFAYALSESGNSLVTNQGLVTKVYFPRLVIPMAPVLSGLVDFSIAFVVLAIMMVYYGIVPGPEAMALPLLVAFASIAAFAVGLWLSALNAQYRDVRYTIPFLTQVWLFATPIAYPASLVPEQWRLLYALNPMVVVVEGFRWALLGRPFPYAPMVVASVAMTLLLLLGGALYFRRVERTLADIV